MQWLNEPASWQRTGDVLRVSVDPGTDFWRTTGYGYVHDNGHIYGELLPGDLDVSVRVRGAFANQYDQAGIMLRADEHTWLKTGLEFFEGRPRLSTVLTMGCSSWMVADLPLGTDEVTLRVSRRGDAVEVRYAAGEGVAELAALVFMPPGREMLAGIVCAAPEGGGFSVAFHDLRITGRDWGGQESADDAEWAAGSAPATGWARDEAAATGAGWDGGGESWDRGRAGDGAPRWAPDRPDGTAPGWTADRPGEAAPGWGRDKREEAVPGWAEKEPGVLAFGWAGKKAGDGASRWGEDEPGDLTSSWARDIAAGMPVNGGGELTRDGAVDWAKPQASEPSEDWERLSLSVSGTGSWNAFAAATPTKQEQKPEGAAEGKAAEPATDQAVGRGGDDGTTEPPGSPAGGKAEPALAAAGPPLAAAKPNGRNGRGRNKAKQPTPRPSVRPTPTDAADEWISLLTADAAEELPAPGADRPRTTPGPRLSSPGSSGSRLPGPRLPGPRLPGPRLPGPRVTRPRDTPWPG
jgi:regulation of enolase protein 1 (concanavalin A-like superfamily)